MPNFQRITVETSRTVSAAADVFFTQLMRWNDILGWPNPPVGLSKVELAPGSELGKVPCTRVCYIDRAQLPKDIAPESVPDYVSETLLAFDSTARSCLYMLDGFGPLGMRNYFATTRVDEIDANSSQITCIGRCDLPAGKPADAIRAMLQATYERGVIGGTASLVGAEIKPQNHSQ